MNYKWVNTSVDDKYYRGKYRGEKGIINAYQVGGWQAVGCCLLWEIMVGLTDNSKLASEQRLKVREEAHRAVNWNQHIVSEGTAGSEALREGRMRYALFLSYQLQMEMESSP